ncbi:MAG: ROK family protein [Flexilinea sp.]
MKKEISGIPVAFNYSPELDPDFIPFISFIDSYLKNAEQPLAIALERDNGSIQVFDTFIHGTEMYKTADHFYVERLVKFVLWSRGGYKLYICGNHEIFEFISRVYSKSGTRSFDFDFMEKIYEHPFQVISCEYKDRPEEKQNSIAIGRNFEGCRIGFDAGGSDRKVSAVIDGNPVFSEEVVWNPKINSDPNYHYEGILDSFRKAAAHMPRVDAIGVSSAGVYVNNQTKAASLFLKVSPDDFQRTIKNIFIDAAKEIGENIPLVVANDGDVTALAGAISLQKNGVLGIAMGTSEAGGFVDQAGNITGWLNELAFVPVDLAPNAIADEWSGDIGCGVKYFSQDGVIKLCAAAGIPLSENLTPAEKLTVVQKLMAENDPRAKKIFETIGIWLGYTLKLYRIFYDTDVVLLLGRVVSGEGGNIILEYAKKVLEKEFPDFSIELSLPSEKSRRVGQSVAAASLPFTFSEHRESSAVPAA